MMKLFSKNRLMKVVVDTATVKSSTVLLESGPTLMLKVLINVTMVCSVTQSVALENHAIVSNPQNTTTSSPPKPRLV
jgi:hypothetical protein